MPFRNVMSIILIFSAVFLLESLLLPALLGPGPFFISSVFILGLILYNSHSLKMLVFRLTLIFLVEFVFVGADVAKSIASLAVTLSVYLGLNKFFDIKGRIEKPFSSVNIAIDIMLLSSLVFLYSFMFILLNDSFDIAVSWDGWMVFFVGSWPIILGWSSAISLLFKSVLKKSIFGCNCRISARKSSYLV